MYISGGENVYPAEVEATLHEHPQVQDAAVLGVPHERWGECGVAFVVADGVGEEELIAWCAQRLAKYKVPTAVRFVSEIPRNSLGKIQKQELPETASVARPKDRVAAGDAGEVTA
jgi:fatty-acyl-CoA synthase